jgi:hypothetical protein
MPELWRKFNRCAPLLVLLDRSDDYEIYETRERKFSDLSTFNLLAEFT